jgi:hypothetical protein
MLFRFATAALSGQRSRAGARSKLLLSRAAPESRPPPTATSTPLKKTHAKVYTQTEEILNFVNYIKNDE